MRNLIQGSPKKEIVKPTARFHVIMGKREIDTIFRSAEFSAVEVREILVNNEGYSPEIRVIREE